MNSQFETANRLWFHEGRTGQALAKYQQALRAAPNDPVVAFQLARVLVSFDRIAEAREVLAQANAHRNQLTRTAQDVLDDWRADLQGPPQDRNSPEFPLSRLDRDLLDASHLPPEDWRAVADAAAAREMYGLAVYALDRWNGVPGSVDEAKEIVYVETRRDTQEGMLARMYVVQP